jgi:Putative prokaryotic signal transducing protein
MREILRTNDPVELSWASAVLESEGIAAIVFDANIAAIEGSISAFQRRLMVSDDDAPRAVAALAGARAALAAGNDS